MNDLSITKFVDTNTGQPNFDDVVTFMLKFGLLVHRTPGLLKQTELNDRIQLIDEERDEFKEAAEAGDLAPLGEVLPAPRARVCARRVACAWHPGGTPPP